MIDLANRMKGASPQILGAVFNMRIIELEPHRKRVTSFYGLYKIKVYDNGEQVLIENQSPIARVKDGVGTVYIYHITDMQQEALHSFFRLNGLRYGMPLKEFKETYCLNYKKREVWSA